VALVCGAIAIAAIVTAGLPPADPPSSLDDYVVFAARRVEFGEGAFIAGGSVGVNDVGGELRMGNDAFVADGNAVVADAVSIGRRSSVFDVFTNALAGSPGIRGGGPTPFTPPVLSLPAPPTFAPGTGLIVIRGGEPPLASGAYGDVIVSANATLHLAGGHYEFASMNVRIYGSVLVGAPSTINVAGRLKIGAFGNFGPADGSLAAGDVRVNVGGSAVRVERTAHVTMDLFAPDARIAFDRSVRAEGRFVGDQFRGEETVHLRRVGTTDAIPSELCTMTQADYGTPASTNPLAPLVASNPSILPVTVGSPGLSSVTVADAASLVCFLPTTGAPASLYLRLDTDPTDTLVNACANPPILDFVPDGDGSSGGLGSGALLGEVIAARLNVALSELGATAAGLGDFVLPTRLCTTLCPKGRIVNPNPMVFQTGAVGVADGQTTVAGLLAFADQAISVRQCRPGTCTETNGKAVLPPNPIRLSDVENALRAVNECSRGCAALTACED
jgi:hypothetical protein